MISYGAVIQVFFMQIIWYISYVFFPCHDHVHIFLMTFLRIKVFNLNVMKHCIFSYYAFCNFWSTDLPNWMSQQSSRLFLLKAFLTYLLYLRPAIHFKIIVMICLRKGLWFIIFLMDIHLFHYNLFDRLLLLHKLPWHVYLKLIGHTCVDIFINSLFHAINLCYLYAKTSLSILY
jgi:hypothetical protein